VNRRNQSGVTALAWARRGGFYDIEKVLQQRGAQQ